MSADEFGGRGFAPGVVTGVRSFDVDTLGRLTGIHYKQVWVPGENVSECRKEEGSPFGFSYTFLVDAIYGTTSKAHQQKPVEAPKPLQHKFADCLCGFYGYFDGSDDYHGRGKVTGVVEAYGETVIGTRGFRAKKSRIVALRLRPGKDGVSEDIARKIRRNYPGVAYFRKFEQMVAEFPADTSYEPSPTTDPDFWTRA